MSSPVLAALANAKAAEQAAEERTLTNAVLKHLKMPAPSGDRSQWPVWASWCAKSNVASYPAQPAAIAVWILNNAALGDRLEKILGSIAAIHEAEGKADPTLSAVVIEALNQVLPPIEPPSGWPKERKADFGRLNRELQKFIVAHERQIVTEMRRAQNEAARAKQKDDDHHGNTQQEPPAARADRTDAGAEAA